MRYGFLFLLFFAAPAFATPYFDAAMIPPTLLSPPNAVDSYEQQTEIEEMMSIQARADMAEVLKAAGERNLKPEMIAAIVDPKLTRAQYPALYTLLDNAGDSEKGALDNAKKFWNIPRPFITDSRVKSLIQPHTNPAYPSGHTAQSYVWAHVLGLLIPEQRAAFLARADEIAQHRVLAGVHYPNDLAGGRELALLVTGALLSNADFQKDFAAAKQEIANANNPDKGK